MPEPIGKETYSLAMANWEPRQLRGAPLVLWLVGIGMLLVGLVLWWTDFDRFGPFLVPLCMAAMGISLLGTSMGRHRNRNQAP